MSEVTLRRWRSNRIAPKKKDDKAKPAKQLRFNNIFQEFLQKSYKIADFELENASTNIPSTKPYRIVFKYDKLNTKYNIDSFNSKFVGNKLSLSFLTEILAKITTISNYNIQCMIKDAHKFPRCLYITTIIFVLYNI